MDNPGHYPTDGEIEKLYLDARNTFYKQHVGHVYIMGMNLGFYKIGLTTDLSKRFSNFGVKLPFEVWLEETKLYFDCAWAERYWHITFSHLRVNGEWFKLEPHHLDTFHHAADDTETDVKLNILYENNDWLPWDANLMANLLKEYPTFILFKKKVIKDFYARNEKDPGPISQYRARWEKRLEPNKYTEADFDKPFDPNKPFEPTDPEG
jgi:hypothetical protein